MNKIFALTKRNIKEILRDPLSIIFCLVFPIGMLVLMLLILNNLEFVPENFRIENYAVGICVFGYTFSMLFVATIIASDKNTEFINRIKLAPISKTTYVLSYLLAMLPITFCQTIIFFAISLFFGLPFSANILLAILYLIPSAIFYISLGILIGTLCKNEKQTGPVSSIIISITGIFGGVFMPIESLGGFYNFINLLPFSHSVQIASGVFVNNIGCIYPHILWVLAYTLVIWFITILLYRKR